jgi:hypothetical protein
MGSPPAVVGMVFEAVCVLLGESKTDWKSAQKLLQNLSGFVKSLKEYDKDNISPKI